MNKSFFIAILLVAYTTCSLFRPRPSPMEQLPPLPDRPNCIGGMCGGVKAPHIMPTPLLPPGGLPFYGFPSLPPRPFCGPIRPIHPLLPNYPIQRPNGEFELSFQWACRKNVPFPSCLGEVFWNDELIYKIEPKDYSVQTQKIIVKAKTGDNKLVFRGSGKSDRAGMTIDNVKLTEVGSSKNLVKNGDFELPRIRHNWERFNWIPGWEVHALEVGKGKVFNDGWNSQIVELDSLENVAISQSFKFDSCFNLQRLDYTLSLQWSSRTSGGRPFNSQRAHVVWNGEVVGTLQPSNNHIQKAEYEVELNEGDNIVQIKAAGRSDSYGLIVDNVKLTPKDSDDNLIINGGFEDPALAPHKWRLVHGSFKGWKVKVGQVGDCRIYNKVWNSRGDNQCIELDSNGNNVYLQNVRISAEKFKALLREENKSGCRCGGGFGPACRVGVGCINRPACPGCRC